MIIRYTRKTMVRTDPVIHIVQYRTHLRDRCRHGCELAHIGVRAIELARVVVAG
jgi:hypothetical protein